MATTPSTLSFDRARYAGDPPSPDACAFCHRGIDGEYFRVNGHLACSACAQQAEQLVPPDSHKAFSRALLFGIGAAIVGCIGYAVFEILTGVIIGWIALVVGLFVGRAMKAGSRGLGGRRYQITAALLTYAAVAVAFIPVALHERSARQTPHTKAVQQTEAEHPYPGDSGAAATPPVRKTASFGGFVGAVFALLGLGLISPLLMFSVSVPSALINLFIIFIGIQMAWKQMVSPRAQVEGPFHA
jgi:predicted lipid-binding transport protein (Tim44 family)